jgi:SAM-dependent methyltransferase
MATAFFQLHFEKFKTLYIRPFDPLSIDDGRTFYDLFHQELSSLKASAKILDFGCGAGGLVLNLNKELPHLEIAGFDANRAAIDFALERNPSLSGKLFSELPQKWRQPGSYDAILFNYSAMFLQPLTQTLQEIALLLKTGGRIIILNPFPGGRSPADSVIATTISKYNDEYDIPENLQGLKDEYEASIDEIAFAPEELSRSLESIGLSQKDLKFYTEVMNLPSGSCIDRYSTLYDLYFLSDNLRQKCLADLSNELKKFKNENGQIEFRTSIYLLSLSKK